MRFLLRALCLYIFVIMPLSAQPQIGGGVCTNSTLSGIYHYLLTGDLLSGGPSLPLRRAG